MHNRWGCTMRINVTADVTGLLPSYVNIFHLEYSTKRHPVPASSPGAVQCTRAKKDSVTPLFTRNTLSFLYVQELTEWPLKLSNQLPAIPLLPTETPEEDGAADPPLRHHCDPYPHNTKS